MKRLVPKHPLFGTSRVASVRLQPHPGPPCDSMGRTSWFTRHRPALFSRVQDFLAASRDASAPDGPFDPTRRLPGGDPFGRISTPPPFTRESLSPRPDPLSPPRRSYWAWRAGRRARLTQPARLRNLPGTPVQSGLPPVPQGSQKWLNGLSGRGFQSPVPGIFRLGWSTCYCSPAIISAKFPAIAAIPPAGRHGRRCDQRSAEPRAELSAPAPREFGHKGLSWDPRPVAP